MANCPYCDNPITEAQNVCINCKGVLRPRKFYGYSLGLLTFGVILIILWGYFISNVSFEDYHGIYTLVLVVGLLFTLGSIAFLVQFRKKSVEQPFETE